MFDGQFFPGQLIQFDGGFVAPPAGGGGGVTMTAGDSGFYVGFLAATNPYGGGAMGSLSGEPLVGQSCAGLVDELGAGQTLIYFVGDCAALLTGKSVTVNGTPYLLQDVGYEGYFSGYTDAALVYGSPLFANAGVYTITVA